MTQADPATEPTPQTTPPPALGLMFHHEDDGGDGRYHVATPEACSCGAQHVGSTKPIAVDDQSLGFKPPEMYCDKARELLASGRTQTVQAQATAQQQETQAIAQQVKRDPVPFHPRDTAEMFRYASFLASSNLIPRALQRNASDILVVLLKGQDLGLTPMQSISGINVIDGKAEVGALMMVSMIRKSGMCESWRLVESTDKIATYYTKRRGETEGIPFSYTIDEAESAGLTRKGRDAAAVARSPWNTQRRTMLRRRCQSMLAREEYPDVCAGLYDHDELREIRELEIDLIRTGMEATRAGLSVVQSDPMAEPDWMRGRTVVDGAKPPPGVDPDLTPALAATLAGVQAAPAVEVIKPPIAPIEPAKPVDPLKVRMQKRAAAAKSAQPDLLSVAAAEPPQTTPTCIACGVPIERPGKCEACINS